jgi:NADPH2:quinone reductase
LWGLPAEAAVLAAGHGARLVNIGQAAGADACFASVPVRSRLVSIVGHTNLAAPPELRAEAYAKRAELALAGNLVFSYEQHPLSEIETIWTLQAEGVHKLMVLPGN